MNAGTTGIEALDRAVQDYNAWIVPLADRLATSERRLAHRALRATLHALRDRIGPENAANLAAQLPLMIRAIFFEGYQPGAIPNREHSRGAFLAQIHDEGVEPLDINVLERATKAVLMVMSERLDQAQMEKLAAVFPEEFSDLWPETPLEWDAPLKTRRSPHAREIIAPREPQRVGQHSRTVRALTGVEEVDQAIHLTTQWIDALEFRLNTQSSRAAWAALTATLQAIGQQMNAGAAMRFGSSLPLPLRGAYYEGWKPAESTPVQTRSGFLQRIELTAWSDRDISVEAAVKAAFEVIARKVPATEMNEVVSALPMDLYALWPSEPAAMESTSQPPSRGAKNVRRARNRAPGQTPRNAIAQTKPGKRAH